MNITKREGAALGIGGGAVAFVVLLIWLIFPIGCQSQSRNNSTSSVISSAGMTVSSPAPASSSFADVSNLLARIATLEDELSRVKQFTSTSVVSATASATGIVIATAGVSTTSVVAAIAPVPAPVVPDTNAVNLADTNVFASAKSATQTNVVSKTDKAKQPAPAKASSVVPSLLVNMTNGLSNSGQIIQFAPTISVNPNINISIGAKGTSLKTNLPASNGTGPTNILDTNVTANIEVLEPFFVDGNVVDKKEVVGLYEVSGGVPVYRKIPATFTPQTGGGVQKLWAERDPAKKANWGHQAGDPYMDIPPGYSEPKQVVIREPSYYDDSSFGYYPRRHSSYYPSYNSGYSYDRYRPRIYSTRTFENEFDLRMQFGPHSYGGSSSQFSGGYFRQSIY